MFSDHIKKSTRFPQTGLLMAAGALVLVCQLVAIALVADQQVQRASVRDLQRFAQQVAFADCIERSTGSAKHSCIRQSQLESNGGMPASASMALEPTFTANNVAMADDAVTTDMVGVLRVGLKNARQPR